MPSKRDVIVKRNVGLNDLFVLASYRKKDN